MSVCCSSSPVLSDGDHPDSENVVSVYGDALQQEEEELRRRIELEAEERKLEETLEYQRRIEEEAKQKHLAEQHKRTPRTIPEKHSDDDEDVCKQLEYCKQVNILPLRSSLVGIVYKLIFPFCYMFSLHNLVE